MKQLLTAMMVASTHIGNSYQLVGTKVAKGITLFHDQSGLLVRFVELLLVWKMGSQLLVHKQKQEVVNRYALEYADRS